MATRLNRASKRGSRNECLLAGNELLAKEKQVIWVCRASRHV